MKAFTQTIVVTVALSLLAAGAVPAGNASDEKIQAVVELQLQKAELEQQKAEIAAVIGTPYGVLAQATTSQPAAPVLPTIPTPATPPTPTSVEAVNNNIYTLTKSLSLRSRADSTGTVLVIPSGQTKTEDLLIINEDMSVMSRIFEKNLETAQGGIFVSRYDPFSMLVGAARGDIQSMYLQGYGALFLLKVDFPLSPSPEMQDDEKETIQAKDGDPVWQEMRRQMYEPENVDRRRRTDRPEEKYDAEKVENLKTTLIQALKHAANIRSLKPDESVILTITGSGQATGTTITAVTRSGENQILVQERTADGKWLTKMVTGSALDDIGLSSPAILFIRAKKSDIDEFAKGDLDFNQFRQRVQMFTCPYLGGAAERGGPFNPYMQLRSTGSRNMR